MKRFFFQDETETLEEKTHHPSLEMYKGSILCFATIYFLFSGVCESKNVWLEG